MIILASKLSFKNKRGTLSGPVVLGALKDIENQPDTNNVRALAGQQKQFQKISKPLKTLILSGFLFNSTSK